MHEVDRRVIEHDEIDVAADLGSQRVSEVDMQPGEGALRVVAKQNRDVDVAVRTRRTAREAPEEVDGDHPCRSAAEVLRQSVLDLRAHVQTIR